MPPWMRPSPDSRRMLSCGRPRASSHGGARAMARRRSAAGPAAPVRAVHAAKTPWPVRKIGPLRAADLRAFFQRPQRRFRRHSLPHAKTGHFRVLGNCVNGKKPTKTRVSGSIKRAKYRPKRGKNICVNGKKSTKTRVSDLSKLASFDIIIICSVMDNGYGRRRRWRFRTPALTAPGTLTADFGPREERQYRPRRPLARLTEAYGRT